MQLKTCRTSSGQSQVYLELLSLELAS